MNIRRLRHLVVLADEGNFRRAAERVHLSQPAFSRSIQAAEAELGLKLFDRGTLEARCTPAGQFVVDRARSLLQQSDRLASDVSLYRERAIGDIAFGSGSFPAAALVPALLAQLRQRYPQVGVCVQVNNPRHLLDYVRREEHDFFVAGTLGVPKNGVFAVRDIGSMPAAFYVRSGHPLLARRALQAADLLPFGLGTGRLPHEVAARLGQLMGLLPDQKLPVAIECDDTHVLKRIALDTDTVIIGTEDLLADEVQRGAMRALRLGDVPAAQAELGIVTLAGRTPSPVAAFAMERLAELALARETARRQRMAGEAPAGELRRPAAA